MSENNKTTIKVKLSDEDYHDIVIDWADETCEYHQQIFQQLVAYTGIPILYINCSIILKDESAILMENTNRLWRAEILNHTEETVRSRLNDGDCFTLHFDVDLVSGYDHLFDTNVNLIDSSDSHGNECKQFWCQHQSTRVYLDKIIGTLTNSELQKKIKAELPAERYSVDGDEWMKLMVNFNIKQYLGGYCTLAAVRQEFRPYLPHRG
ncbi:uncharacterized protein LOC107365859 isoform X2 [Tetranychus urticae]|uniref:Uncharacterized protein n=1 Tax=Tetranychus urticae TaxID=32264 RepID=T1KP91_TETUR|nr:uncharacterized protein LOC107365859 isoform X2 [Tetranychus urticae]